MKFGMPEVWVRRLKIVILSQLAGASGRYFFTGSMTLSLPRSSKSKIEAEVNCFVIDPSRNFVLGALGMSHSTSAGPYPLLNSTSFPRATNTEPMNCWLEA